MRKHIGAVCAGLAVMVAFAGEANAATDQTEKSVMDSINAIRADHGLRQLHASPSLADSAGRWSATQMRSDYYGHAARIQASSRFRTLGEVIYLHGGGQPRVGQTVSAWMHSAIHTQILLSPAFRYVGAGRATGDFNGRRTTIWTVQLGA